jgi:hypothetical protein
LPGIWYAYSKAPIYLNGADLQGKQKRYAIGADDPLCWRGRAVLTWIGSTESSSTLALSKRQTKQIRLIITHGLSYPPRSSMDRLMLSAHHY